MPEANPDHPQALVFRRQNPLKRVGCTIGLLLWAVVLISPCLLCTLATQGQITISLGSAPGQQARIWLLNEARERGIGISWPSAHYSQDAQTVCVQTDTRFVLWEGSGQPATYCECYTRENTGEAWIAAQISDDSCQP